MSRWFSPLRFALVCALLDGAWAAQALAEAPRHAGSNVAMVSFIVWVAVHLPAAAVAGAVMAAAGATQDPAAPLPAWSFFLTAGLGLLETFALAYGLAAWLKRRRP